MNLIMVAGRSVADGLTRRFQMQPPMLKAFSTFFPGGHNVNENENSTSVESLEDFERRILGDNAWKSSPASDSFYKKLDKCEKTRDRTNLGSKGINGDDSDSDCFTTLSSDGMDRKLEKAATKFDFNPDEIIQNDFPNRPDERFVPGNIVGRKDLDFRRPRAPPRPFKMLDFTTTTKEVLRKADFRNVRFLANFITEAGIIKKRSTTKISAKAQRKIAREIKTARAFGLMPFTTMGTKKFVYGMTMKTLEDDFEYDAHVTNSIEDAEENADEDPLEP